MDGVESGDVGGLTGFDLVLEHVEGSTVGITSLLGSTTLAFELARELPVALVLFEEERSAIVTSTSDLTFTDPEEIEDGQVRELNGLDFSRSTSVDINNADGRVVAGESESVSRRRPLDGVNPSSNGVFSENLTKDELRTEGSVINLLVLALDSSSENASLEVRRGGGQEDVVGVPVNGGDGGLMLLDVLADPPVVVDFEVANRDALGTRGDGELVFLRAPLNSGGSATDTQDYESGLPHVVLELPHVSVSVLRARNDAVALGRPVNTGHTLSFIVFTKNVLEFPFISILLENVNLVVGRGESKLF